LFSAITSAFIVDVQDNLQPDYEQMNYQLLKIMASVSLGNVPTGENAAIPQQTGPDPTVVHAQAIHYSNLANSFLAAFVAINGSIVTLKSRCVDPPLIAVGIGSAR